ncbi:MAG: twin-arginine translocase subunit TatC [Chlamydiales bacterium]|nr:twin-arginine translocase subunit TatC [Chlamydiia bacterium]MCP5507434.1 twin-arginine translocase subunit TatC [Chlamydiales bacterium]
MEEKLSLWDHLDDFRSCLIKMLLAIGCGFCVALACYARVFQWLTPAEGPPLYLFSPLDGISVTIKLCFWVGLAVSSPIWCFFLFEFLSPGLNIKEKRVFIPFFTLSSLFFFGGMAFAHYVTIPLANGYLLALNNQIGQNLWSLSAYIDYALLLYLANGIAFESCLILLFLVHFGICTAPFMVQKRKPVIISIFVISALLTPPDVVTQLLMALPLLLIYEGAIIYSRLKAPLFSVEAKTSN